MVNFHFSKLYMRGTQLRPRVRLTCQAVGGKRERLNLVRKAGRTTEGADPWVNKSPRAKSNDKSLRRKGLSTNGILTLYELPLEGDTGQRRARSGVTGLNRSNEHSRQNQTLRKYLR